MSRHLLLMPPNWIGDVIMAQPAMRAMALHYRQQGYAQITLCGRPWLADLLPFLNLPDAHYRARLPKAERAVLFPNSFRAAWQCRKAGVKEIIGYRGQWRRMLLHRALPHRISLQHEHHRQFYLDIARQLSVPIEDEHVSLQVPEGAIEHAHELMAMHGIAPERAICIAPGAQFGAAKCYPEDGFKLVTKKLAAAGWQPIILGMEADIPTARLILSGITTPSWNAAGTTSLTQALCLIAASRLMLCNDSGLMHAAAGLQIPTVVPFGATDPARTAPDGKRVEVIYQPADCSPCLQRECRVEGHPCMQNIPPRMLYEAATRLLEGA